MNTPTKFLLTAVLSLGLAVSAHAATLTWTGGGDGTSWNDADNWGGSTPASGDTLIFTSAANGQTLNNNTAADNAYIINFATGSDNITFSGNRVTAAQNAWFTTAVATSFGSHTVNFDVVMANPAGGVTSFRPMSPNTFTVNGLLSGASGLQSVGSGNLLVTNANNTFDGFISVMQGTTMSFTSIGNVGQNSSLGTGSSDASIRLGSGATSGTLNFVGSTDSTTDRVIQQTGTAVNRINANGTSGARLVFTGDGDGFFNQQHLATTGTRTLALGGASTANNEISGVIRNWSSNAAGHTAITKDGTGTWILSGNNTYTGATTVSAGTLVISGNNSARSGATTINAGTLVAAHNNALGAGTTTLSGTANTGTLALQGGITLAGPTVQYQGRNDNYLAPSGGIRSISGNNTLTALGAGGGVNYAFSADAGSTLNVNWSTAQALRTYVFTGAGDINLLGNLSAHTVVADNDNITIYQNSTGTTLVQNTALYEGRTVVNQGTLVIEGRTGAATGAHSGIEVASGATLRGISNGAFRGALSNSGTVIFDAPSGIWTPFEEMSGSGEFIMRGAGTLAMNATDLVHNNLTGLFTVEAGTVAFGGDGGAGVRIPNAQLNMQGGAVTFAGGAEFTFGSLQGTSGISLQTTSNAAINLVVGGNDLSTTYSGDLTGLGSLTKDGDGTMTLAGNNSYTGATTINTGTLVLAEGATMTFYIGDDGVNNSILGDGTVNLDGQFIFDLTGADAVGSWTIVASTLTKNFGSTFSVAGWSQSGTEWTSGDFTFDQSTGVLTAVPEPATYALIGGLLALGAVLIRRRMK